MEQEDTTLQETIAHLQAAKSMVSQARSELRQAILSGINVLTPAQGEELLDTLEILSQVGMMLHLYGGEIESKKEDAR